MGLQDADAHTVSSMEGSDGQPQDATQDTAEPKPLKDNPKKKRSYSHSVIDMMASEEDAVSWTSGEVSTQARPSPLKASSTLLLDASSLSRLQTSQESRKWVVVLGSGDFGLALIGRLVKANYQVVVGSRNPQKARERVVSAGASVMSHEEALQHGKVVVVAVPFTHVASLPVHLLAGKIVIDVSNRSPKTSKTLGSISQAEQLQAMVPGARVVKAFNVLSAYALTRSNLGSKEVPVCGDDEGARRVVCGMARDLHFTPLDLGRLTNAREVEAIPLGFFKEWQGAFTTSLVIWIAFFLILLFEWQLCDHLQGTSSDWSSLSSITTRNISIASADASLTLLSLCYLPGVFAAYLQLSRGTKFSRFPGWLDRWMRCRKQLGLLMLFHAALHVIFKLARSPLSGRASWRYNSFISTGVFALVFAGILGVTSLPSVAGSMTWREFTFVQSKLGWLTLLLSTLHLVFAGWDELFQADFTCYLPSSSQIVMVLPLLTFALKLPLLLPCVDSLLADIRQGCDRPPCCLSRSRGAIDH